MERCSNTVAGLVGRGGREYRGEGVGVLCLLCLRAVLYFLVELLLLLNNSITSTT